MPGKKQVSVKRKFVKDGIFYAELNDFLTRELAESGYSGVEVRVTPTKTNITIRATQSTDVVGDHGRRIKELTLLVQQRFKFAPGTVELFAAKVQNKALSALAQAEAVRYKLMEGLSVRRACYSVLRFVMDNKAKGCEVVVSGKLRGQRAKSMKFREGYMIHAGDAVNYYIDRAIKHIKLKQGVLGIKVKIMLPYDPNKEFGGVQKNLPDTIVIKDPIVKEDVPQDFGVQKQLYDDAQQQSFVPQQPAQQLAPQQGGQFGGGYQDPNVGGVPQYDPAVAAVGPAADQYGVPPQAQQPADQYVTPQGPPQDQLGYGQPQQYDAAPQYDPNAQFGYDQSGGYGGFQQ